MADTNGQILFKPVAIAPAPGIGSSTSAHANGSSSPPTMPYTCQTCAKRKVKCDKTLPACSTCRKGKLECIYQARPPRQRKRMLSSDIHEKLARYERILHENGLLPQDDTSPSVGSTPREVLSLRSKKSEPPKLGKLLASQGKSRYIDSNFWQNLDQDDAMQRISDDEEEDQVVIGVPGIFASDPLTEAFMGSKRDLLRYHPSHAEAILLWKMHGENVEPICKVLHIPSTSTMLERVSQQPASASKVDECLLFAIYHFAVYSITEEECVKVFGQSRKPLMERFHFACRQALVNASFLKTSELSILQSLVLFLLPCRYIYDPHTYWMLTGVATRLSQRMGLHHDGERLGLPPFEVQMRRRLFFQVIPLESLGSQLSGAAMPPIPDSWDFTSPLNINDDQIWPGMTETPVEQKGATEMMFCLARSTVGKVFASAESSMRDKRSGLFKDYKEFEPVISKMESEVEEKYVRYCDIVNPLHFLTIGLARTAITAMRIRIRMPKVKNKTVTDEERKELFRLSLKILDTDTAAYAHTGLKKFMWHVRSFFAYGSWDSLIFVLTTLQAADLLSPMETNAAWERVRYLYENHRELLELRRALQIAIGRLTLKAWNASPPSSMISEPAFIATLRSVSKVNPSRGNKDSNANHPQTETDTISSFGPSPTSDASALFGILSDSVDFDMGNGFNLDTVDALFWDQLIQDYQTQGGQQQDGNTI